MNRLRTKWSWIGGAALFVTALVVGFALPPPAPAYGDDDGGCARCTTDGEPRPRNEDPTEMCQFIYWSGGTGCQGGCDDSNWCTCEKMGFCQMNRDTN
jgi:hypothetical protein